MEVRAHLRFLRTTPRKVRLVINLIRGMEVEHAFNQLAVLPKGVARPITKLLASAVANAEHNFQLRRADMIIKSIVANEGPKLKRYRPRAHGSAAPILKRLSHVTIVLEDKAKSAPKKGVKPEPVEPLKLDASEVKKSPAKPEVKAAAPAPKADPSAKEKSRAAGDAEVARKGES